MMFVYIITCDGGDLGDCFYVGTWGGDSASTRFFQHKQGRGSKFTKKYPPKSFQVVGRYSNSEGMRVENQITINLLREFGFRRVRGGNYLNMQQNCHTLSALKWWLPHCLQDDLQKGVLGFPDPVPVF